MVPFENLREKCERAPFNGIMDPVPHRASFSTSKGTPYPLAFQFSLRNLSDYLLVYIGIPQGWLVWDHYGDL